MQSKLEAQERFWKSKLKQIEIQYMKEAEELKIQLNHAKGEKVCFSMSEGLNESSPNSSNYKYHIQSRPVRTLCISLMYEMFS